jgi:YtkA-like
MNSHPILYWAIALAALGIVAACSSSDAATCSDCFPATPYTTLMSDNGKIRIELTSAPEQPPSAGLDAVQLILTDPKTGAPILGEQIALTPWMPTMGHGTDVIPVAKEMGKGRYVLSNVNLYMPGKWQLRFQFSGPVTDTSEPSFDDVE